MTYTSVARQCIFFLSSFPTPMNEPEERLGIGMCYGKKGEELE